MGKRGPKPKEEAARSHIFSVRLRSDLRESLQNAAKQNRRTLSEEIQKRLGRTFFEDEKIADSFGNRRNYLVMRIVALAVQWQWDPFFTMQGDWLDDPLKFDQAVKTVNLVLKALRPPGPKKSVTITTERFGRSSAFDPEGVATLEFTAHQGAAIWLKAINEADLAAPINKGNRIDHQMRMLKSELGDVVTRSSIKPLSAGDLKRMIAKAKKKTKTRTKSRNIQK